MSYYYVLIALGILAYWFMGCLCGGIVFRLLKNHQAWTHYEAYSFAVFIAFSWPISAPFLGGLIIIEWLGKK